MHPLTVCIFLSFISFSFGQCFNFKSPTGRDVSYHLSCAPDSWYSLSVRCVDGNSVNGFASVPDSYTNSWLAKNLSAAGKSNGKIWLGGAVDHSGQWSWMDTTNFSSYANWAKGEPKATTKGYCLAMDAKTGLWYAENCSTINYGVCETLPKDRHNFGAKCPLSVYTDAYMNIMDVCQMSGVSYSDAAYGSVDEVICQSIIGDMLDLKGFHLASIHDPVENMVVNSSRNGDTSPFIIGIHDPYNNGTFEWYDGTPVTYTNWASDPPHGSCAYMIDDSDKWYPVDCNATFDTASVLCVLPAGDYSNYVSPIGYFENHPKSKLGKNRLFLKHKP